MRLTGRKKTETKKEKLNANQFQINYNKKI